MKIAMVSLMLLAVFSLDVLAQEYTQWHLPESAKVRLGKGAVHEIEYSPDGTRLAVASYIGIWLYDTETLEEVALITDKPRRIGSIAFDSTGERLVSGGGRPDYEVRLWNAKTGEHLRTFTGNLSIIERVALSPDDTTLAGGGNQGAVYLWDVQTGVRLHTLKDYTTLVSSVAFSPDGRTLAAGDYDNRVRVWDVQTGAHLQTLKGQAGHVSDVAFSLNGTLATGSWDSTVRLWNPNTWAVLRELRATGGTVTTVAFNSDGSAVAAGNLNRTVDIWNSGSGRHLMTLRGHTKKVVSIAFSPDDSKLASASEDGTVRIWDTETWQQEGAITAHPEWPLSMAFSPDGSSIATGHLDRSVRLWDPKTGRILNRLTGLRGFANAVTFNVDGTKIAGASGGEIHFWNPKTGKLLDILTGDFVGVRAVAFSPDGSMVASGEGSPDHSLRLWDTNTGKLLHTLAWHTWEVMSVAFSADSLTLAGASRDGTVSLWHTKTGLRLRSLTGDTQEVVGVAFSRDGRKMASASIHKAIIWDAETWEPLHTLVGHIIEAGVPAFSPDSRTLAWGSLDRTVRLWDVDTGESLRSMPGHSAGIGSVAFSPDGTLLASASWDGTVLVWNLAPFPTVDSTVSITPSLATSPSVGEQMTVSLDIAEGSDVVGYQASIGFNPSALQYVEAVSGDYLPADSFFVPPVIGGDRATLGGAAFSGASEGDGTLATLTFEVVEPKLSFLTLSQVSLVNTDRERLLPRLEHGRIAGPEPLVGDVNGDDEVNILDLVQVAANFTKTGKNDADVNGDSVVDILDLVQVAWAIGAGGAAPSAHSSALSVLSAADVESWIAQAQGLNLTDPRLQRGIRFLAQLLAVLTPQETMLLPNYPNPFNPETWIPYHLAQGAEVEITIYDAKGALVRRLALGHRAAGYYTDQGSAAYWDGRNESGEPVASGVYFYQLRAGDYAASRRMVIVK